MKKMITMGMLGAAMLFSFSACNGNSATKTEEDTSTEVVDIIPIPETDSISRIFQNPDFKSETATDSTYAETPSGLKYMILTEGTGKSPASTDEVTVNYEGKLTTGYVFDSSYTRGEPATFPLNRVIAGWTEGLQLMREGGKALFYIPSDLGYGPQGNASIPPNSDLVFLVELIKVN